MKSFSKYSKHIIIAKIINSPDSYAIVRYHYEVICEWFSKFSKVLTWKSNNYTLKSLMVIKSPN